ncbi:MAG TPA: HD domain-containing phosphohydrolase [Bdellovibrionales bacterium]|nr:HD domain-containing phosphohydrolase [Bdellovibrionales bacterium]
MKKRPSPDNVIELNPRQSEPIAVDFAGMSGPIYKEEIGKILDMILEKAIQNSNADAGSIYIIEKVRQDSYGGALPKYRQVLKFYRATNRTSGDKRDLPHIEIDNRSIAGYVAMTGNTVRIKDCYKLTGEEPFHFFAEIDKKTGYKTTSVLSVPIKSVKGNVIGVVQLVNKISPKRRKNDRQANDDLVVPFTKQDENLIDALATHAGVALENVRLSSDIANLFESFVRASVTAIEARDPSTSGHSDRVALLTVRLAEVVDRVDAGQFAAVRFSPQQIQEIRYASLLHDFGKIGVRENILLKAKKLFPHELETIMLRLETLKAKNEARSWKQAAEQLSSTAIAKPEERERHYSQTLWNIDRFNQQVETVRKGVHKANESQVMDGDFDITGLLNWLLTAAQNVGQAILTDSELRRLSIARGTLAPEERREIESHVSYTYKFLSQIAWTEELSNIPNIAHAHHEKLDGTGYPQALQADKIPLQSRMMTIADIYDALTAMDRPYKKAVSAERAIEILHYEAKAGKLDRSLLQIFCEAEVFKIVETFPVRKVG